MSLTVGYCYYLILPIENSNREEHHDKDPFE
jgi:hypothetical protein